MKMTAELQLFSKIDALQVAAAIAFKASYVITRNTKDYRQSPVPAITPKEFSLKIS